MATSNLKLTINLRLILTLFVFSTILLTSCSEDEADEILTLENIVGTSWKCTAGPGWEFDIEYFLFVFKSKTMVEGWVKFIDTEEFKDWEGSFIVSNNQISISSTYGLITGIIDEDKMILEIDGETYFFFKE